jgi:hypothetical protein
MPKISFCFSGWVVGANIRSATDDQGNDVDVTGLTSKELVKKLKAGELIISLSSSLNDNDDYDTTFFYVSVD